MRIDNCQREVKSVEDWDKSIDQETQGKRGSFRFLPREIFSSHAYRDLKMSEREVLHCYLNKLNFLKRDKGDKRRMKRSGATPENADRLILTTNEIKARRGVTSERTISNARKRLVEIGFLDVVQPSKFPQPGIFALSDRWRKYPDGNYLPLDNKPVSFAPYSRKPEHGKFRKKP